jgi:hypothetical protein
MIFNKAASIEFKSHRSSFTSKAIELTGEEPREQDLRFGGVDGPESGLWSSKWWRNTAVHFLQGTTYFWTSGRSI